MTPEMQLQIFGDPNYLEKNQIQFYDGSFVPTATPFADTIESAGIRSIPLGFDEGDIQFPIGFKKPTPFVNDELTRAIIARNQGAVDLADLDTTSELSDDPNLMLPDLEQGRPLRSSIFTTGDVVPDTVDSLYFTRGQNRDRNLPGIVPALLGRLQNFDSRVRPMQDFYGSRFGLDNIGRVASGPMAGYNPVSGGLLYSLSGGRAGQPTNVGLQRALQKRIDTRTSQKTLDRLRKTGADIDAFNRKTKELQDLIKEERQNRIDTAPRDVRQQIAENRKIDSDTKFGAL